MSEEEKKRKRGALVLWGLAGLATLGTVIVLAMVLGNLVPRNGPVKGDVVGGVDIEAMKYACKLARGELGLLCDKTGQVDEMLRSGRCPAARSLARPVLESRESLGPLAADMRAYLTARIDTTCEPR